MSWDSYIDSVVGYGVDAAGEHHVDSVAIIGTDGSKWTSDNHANSLKIQPDEIQAIVNAFKCNDFSSFQTNGIKVNGVRYKMLRSEDDLILAKQKEQGALVVQRSTMAIVIAHMPEGRQQGKTNAAVAKIVEYLAGSGY